MAPLAEIMHNLGYRVSGSDNNESETFDRIKSLGFDVSIGQRPENIVGADLIIYTAALLPDNPELLAAKSSGIPTFGRAKLLGEITRRYKNCIGISGTHGKTTVSSMLTQVLLDADFSPSAIIGGKLMSTQTNSVLGDSDHLICEACEFEDTFLELFPDISVILNIGADHLDYFKTVENLIASFKKFAAKASNLIVFNGDDPKVLKATASLKNRKTITFGHSLGNDYSARNTIIERGFPSFDVYKGESFIGRLDLAVPGEHNILNALVTCLLALEVGVDFEVCKNSLAEFRGAGRRFELLGSYKGITFADDYAHHPKEIEATLKAALQMGYKRVWAVFQPFTFSRTSLLLNEFAEALSLADKVVMTEVMGSREVNTYHIYTYHLAEKIEGSVWFDTFEKVAAHVVEKAQSGDLVITLGCGDVYKVAQIMIDKVK
ncbi:MAG: UDP-N-acetylmuramate--L-alanine ligase [Clostridiales bacterium]|nr:UDP-N-acetylmuramate--L-alanine ligase [Clostridiales bacterium]